MKVWIGHFEGKNPCVRITVNGDCGKPIEIAAIIDTGFSGFLLMPVYQALPLGLVYVGTTTANLADGSKRPMMLAMASVTFAGRTEIGVVSLPGPSTSALVGLDFLRQFKLALVITSSVINLIDEADLQRLS